jgi:hypothetical protein
MVKKRRREGILGYDGVETLEKIRVGRKIK